jgi:hypothetical protein
MMQEMYGGEGPRALDLIRSLIPLQAVGSRWRVEQPIRESKPVYVHWCCRGSGKDP